ncbi:MAG TPA: flavodoxin domain-containing protein [Gemmatimonadaceae bacterium]|nr:flavodoxin domain-containing protein [Gemmatimonadaceae bacterium]
MQVSIAMAQQAPNVASDQRGRVLVFYASGQEHAGVIANAIAARIRSHGLGAEVDDASCGMMPPPRDYEGVVLGSPVGFGSRTRLIERYIRHHRDALAEVPAALFTVSASGTVRDCDPATELAHAAVSAERTEPHASPSTCKESPCSPSR